jgi:long-chain fatty acid transport protein
MSFRKKAASIILFSLAAAPWLHATNGDQMIATGTRSMGMGGVSVAMPFGAESGPANPALITYVEKSEVSGSVTLFFPTIKTGTDLERNYHESDSDFYLMPSVQYATRLGENAYAGIGAWGVAGMGVDFSDVPAGSGLLQMQDDLMIMHIAVPLALREGGMSIGVAPVLQVGMLDIEYKGLTGHRHPFDKDLEANIGAVIGLAYDFGNGLILGAKYRTPISMTYHNSETGNDLTLEQPGEFGLGFSYTYGAHTLAFDYKRIQWGSAAGYEAFGWRDQNVYAAGYQYAGDGWALRLGYNRGKSPIDTSRTVPFQDYLNLLGFPATSEEHYTLGFGYSVNPNCSIDFAAVYSPEKKTDGVIREGLLGDVLIRNKHSELSLTAQINYTF